ncbi:MAG: hypothetical protein P1U87_11655 [Verrucomicrobiales bacterium]|nr:hypothetical protein [Verrucomicrobiales bacterium]
MSEEDTNFEAGEGPEEPTNHSQDDQEAPQREPIPSVLHSFYEDRPFVSCTRCGESLEHFEEGYRISKNFKGEEVIVEYALCMPCLNAMLDEASEESKQRLAEFQNERYRDVSGFNDCALCDKQFDEVKDEEYGLVGVCHGDDMVDSAMICFGCMEDMSEIMSEETRRTWDKFREENFPGVPSDFEPFPSRPAPVTL